MTEKTYSVKEIFYTCQAEGYWSGHAAVFVRLAGCNMWSGQEEHRERDAERNSAQCPRWCDTDFVNGYKMSLDEIAKVHREVLGQRNTSVMTVISGGEPLLQVDGALVDMLMLQSRMVSIETNGTLQVPRNVAGRAWITCSPKQEPEELRISPSHVHELKVVYPAYDPLAYEKWAANKIAHMYVQPQAPTTAVGVSVVSVDAMQQAARFVMQNPRWAYSLQTHKLLSIP